MRSQLQLIWLFLGMQLQHWRGHCLLLYLLHIPGCLSSLLHLVMWKVEMEVLWTSPRGFGTEKKYIWETEEYPRREDLSAWETSSWVTESWHSFYLFIKFVTVEISLRSCRPITVSFIILLRHTLRHSRRLNPIVLCNKPIIDYAMEL